MKLLFKLSQSMAFLTAFIYIAYLSPQITEDANTCDFNVILCIDSSLSVSNATFEQEVNFAQMYYKKVKELSKTNVELAIILYATFSDVTLTFSNDITEINEAFIKLKTKRKPGQHTETSKCLKKAKKIKKPNNYPNLLLVVTDGEDTSKGKKLKKFIYDVVHNSEFLIHFAQIGEILSDMMEFTYNQKNFLFVNSFDEIEHKLKAFIDRVDICKELITCENFPYMPGVVNSNCQNKKQDESCSIECRKNYIKTSDTITCLGRDAWRPHDACKKNFCDKDLYIPNSINPVCSNHNSGDFCSIECLSNYKSSTNNADMYCKKNEWTNIPICLLKRCSEFFFNVDHASKYIHWFDEKIERYYVICETGYTNTSEFIECKNGEYWERNLKCIEEQCNEFPENTDLDLSDCLNKKVGQTCDMKCNGSYKTIYPSEKHAQCILSKDVKKWVNIPQCDLIFCRHPPTILNAVLDDCSNATEGGVCEFECDNGYVNVNETVRCTSTNTWSTNNVEELCVQETCLIDDLRSSTSHLSLKNCENVKVNGECQMECVVSYQRTSSEKSKCLLKRECINLKCTYEKKWTNIPGCVEKRICADPALDKSKKFFLNTPCLELLEGQTCEVECRNDYYEQIERATKEATCALNETCLAIDGVDIDDCTFWKNMPVCRPKCLVKEGIEQYKHVDWERCLDSTNGQNCTLTCKGDSLSLETINATLCVLENCEHGEENCTISAKWENVPECVAPLKSEKQEKIVPLVLVGGSALVAASSVVALRFATSSVVNTMNDIPTNMLHQNDLYGDAAITDAEIVIL